MVPHTEDFTADAANWYDGAGVAPVSWVAVGGPDGGSYATTSLGFVNQDADATPILFRGQDEFGFSENAFVGNWVAAGVDGYGYAVRHDAPAPLVFFTRFSSPINFPGGVSLNFVPVAPGSWVQINVPIPDPSMVFEGPFGFEQVFSNIGHLQIGISVPESLAGDSGVYNFDLDKVAIAPEPVTGVLLAAGLVAVVAGRRRGLAGRGRVFSRIHG